MAFTFEELEVWLPGKSYPNIQCTIIITQEDGRTAYLAGYINPFYTHFIGEGGQQFSDRVTEFKGSSGSLYRQGFTVQDDSIDNSGFEFTKLTTDGFNLKLINKRWNATVNVHMTKATQAKLYIGWGETIGFGSGMALYSFSINSAIETPG